MSDKSAIEWTDATWNPTSGCTQITPGCAHCYAKTLTERFHGKGSFDTVILHPERLEIPLRWKKPRRVFVDSMSDLFHEDIPEEFIADVFAIMLLTPQHTYQVLTKRPERMRTLMQDFTMQNWWRNKAVARLKNVNDKQHLLQDYFNGPLPNVWLGVTVENQRWADHRIPLLLDTPAAVRFVSAEPLLEDIDLDRYVSADWHSGRRDLGLPCVDWVIIGGESGPKHRHFDPQWARNLVGSCAQGGAAAFVKQLGGARPGNKLEDLPEDLRVREYPV